MKNSYKSILFHALLLVFTHLTYSTYHSQSQQDKYLNERIFKSKKNGVFVDVGAHDGVTYSNTLFFEQELSWTGICIEPHPVSFKKLNTNRSCICIQACISIQPEPQPFLCVISANASEYTEMLSGLLHTYDSRHLNRIDNELAQYGGTKEVINVPCYSLTHIFQSHNLHHIDYLSIDVEGAELEVLRSIDFSLFNIDVISIENNFNTNAIELFLDLHGYQFVTILDGDEIYRKIR